MSDSHAAWYQTMRYGLFIHFGLYSILGRGEWAMNKEEIPPEEYARLADQFHPDKMDFDALIDRAKNRWGMRYAILTTKHHDGFCLYNSSLTDFSAPKTACGRDLVQEFLDACRKHGMKIGLYHSLNDWTTKPNAVDALEDRAKNYDAFIATVHGQIRDLLTTYGPVDVMWYDGWWPFGPEDWQADRLNAMVRELVPGILVNGRTGRKGDFDTPEGHVSASESGPWEACMTLNENWGYHAGDPHWKSPGTVASLLRQCAAGGGNLLLNVGPRGDGSIPEASVEILDQVGDWLKLNGEAIYPGERFEMSLRERGNGRSDWTHCGAFTAAGNELYLHIKQWPGSVMTICGLECQAVAATFLPTGAALPFTQVGGKLVVSGLPETFDVSKLPALLRVTMDRPPMLYKSGGLRNPTVPHCHYDPVESDLAPGH